MWRRFPMLTFAVLAYNAAVFGFADPAVKNIKIKLPSQGEWVYSLNDAVLTFALILLFVEVIKATRTCMNSIIDHAFSMVLFVAALVEFIIVPRCATSTFFLILLMSAIDVIAGFTVTITSARRDYGPA